MHVNVAFGMSSHYLMTLINVEMRIRVAYLTLSWSRGGEGVEGEEDLAGVVGRAGGGAHSEDAH